MKKHRVIYPQPNILNNKGIVNKELTYRRRATHETKTPLRNVETVNGGKREIHNNSYKIDVTFPAVYFIQNGREGFDILIRSRTQDTKGL